MSRVDECEMAATAARWLENNFRRRAKNDPDHALVWEHAADIASDVVASFEHIVDDIKAGRQ